jgi:dTDP-4-amino-4,6-dideoxygalactose transaminase
MRIPLHKPPASDAAAAYVAESLSSGHLGGDGPYTARCHRWLEERLAKPAFLTTSCTSALEMAITLLGLKRGDEVIIPSFTFVSSANVFFSRGITPVFVDVRGDTLNLDEQLLAPTCTRRTKAIVPVHYAGVGCEMDAIVEFARDRDLFVIEDAAHCFGSKYRDRYLGTIGDVGCYSFHETKGVTCGEGGAIAINRAHDYASAEVVWNMGTDRRAFQRGEVASYTWRSGGSSYFPSDLIAALLLDRLEGFDRDAHERKLPDHCEVTPDIFYILLPTRRLRDDLMDLLTSHGIAAAFHYLPLHLSPVGRELGYQEGDCPTSESVASRLLRLPFYSELAPVDMDEIVDRIRRFVETRALRRAESA